MYYQLLGRITNPIVFKHGTPGFDLIVENQKAEKKYGQKLGVGKLIRP